MDGQSDQQSECDSGENRDGHFRDPLPVDGLQLRVSFLVESIYYQIPVVRNGLVCNPNILPDGAVQNLVYQSSDREWGSVIMIGGGFVGGQRHDEGASRTKLMEGGTSKTGVEPSQREIPILTHNSICTRSWIGGVCVCNQLFISRYMKRP